MELPQAIRCSVVLKNRLTHTLGTIHGSEHKRDLLPACDSVGHGCVSSSGWPDH